MKRATMLLVTLIVALNLRAYAFEVWGFKSGMTERQVAQVAGEQGYSRARPYGENKPPYLGMTYISPNTPGLYGGSYIATFCHDRLTWLSLDYKPTLGTLVEVLKDLSERYGNPTVFPTTQSTTMGLLRSLYFDFPQHPKDFVEVIVNGFPASETMSSIQVTHDTKEQCRP